MCTAKNDSACLSSAAIDPYILAFKVCGISNSLDGLEDDAIHCFKPDGPCPNGRTLLLNAMLDESIDEDALTSGLEEIDIGQDLENGCESDSESEIGARK